MHFGRTQAHPSWGWMEQVWPIVCFIVHSIWAKNYVKISKLLREENQKKRSVSWPMGRMCNQYCSAYDASHNWGMVVHIRSLISCGCFLFTADTIATYVANKTLNICCLFFTEKKKKSCQPLLQSSASRRGKTLTGMESHWGGRTNTVLSGEAEQEGGSVTLVSLASPTHTYITI